MSYELIVVSAVAPDFTLLVSQHCLNWILLRILRYKDTLWIWQLNWMFVTSLSIVPKLTDDCFPPIVIATILPITTTPLRPPRAAAAAARSTTTSQCISTWNRLHMTVITRAEMAVLNLVSTVYLTTTLCFSSTPKSGHYSQAVILPPQLIPFYILNSVPQCLKKSLEKSHLTRFTRKNMRLFPGSFQPLCCPPPITMMILLLLLPVGTFFKKRTHTWCFN